MRYRSPLEMETFFAPFTVAKGCLTINESSIQQNDAICKLFQRRLSADGIDSIRRFWSIIKQRRG